MSNINDADSITCFTEDPAVVHCLREAQFKAKGD